VSTTDRGTPPEPGPVRAFALPTATRGRLASGLTVLAARHGDLPLVTALLVTHAGAAEEPAEGAGIAQLTLEALEAGTRHRSGDQIALDLEGLGVELESHLGWDSAVLRVTVPRDRLDAALSIVSEVVREPAFPDGEIQRLRDEQLAAILQRLKEPRGLAADMAARFIFSAATPYARPLLGRRTTVETLTTEHVRDYHAARFRPASAALIFAGAITAEEAADHAQRHFGGWEAGAAEDTDFEVRPAAERAAVHIVDRPGSVQSEIRIGHVGVERTHPDHAALAVLNTLLGGAFTSRLNMNLRERHGFTYGASSGFHQRRRPGAFLIATAVATEVTARAVEEAMREVAGLRASPPPDAELAAARDYLVGVLPLELQTTEQLAARLAEQFVHALPADFLQRDRDAMAAVTGDDVLRVARQHLRPDAMATLVVGDAAAVREPLAALGLGPVETHQLDELA
jgi:zinc protease